MTTTVWVDGEVGDAASARVHAVDHGVTVGDGVFETCKVVDGVPFALTRHLARLARSAAALGLSMPDDEELRRAARETLAAHEKAEGPLAFGRLRITLTGGAGPLGSDRAPGVRTLVVAAAPAAYWPGHIAVATVPWVRNERSAVAGAKTTSYAENVVALEYAHARGAHEAIFANTRGELCEGTGSNVFVAVDGVLVTPPLDSGCLAGITRELLLEWAAKEGLPVEERPVPLEVLATAEDVVLTSSTRDVQRVSVVDGRELRGGETGTAAAELFARRAAEGMDP
jgi:branched-chain amino acid aminotransferase